MTYRRFPVPTKDVADLAKLVGYRRKTACIVVSPTVTLSGLNWSGGSRSEYTAVDLDTLRTSTRDFSRPAPWDNPHEGMSVDIPDGMAVLQHGTFCGKPGLLTIHVAPGSLAKALPTPEGYDAAVDH